MEHFKKLEQLNKLFAYYGVLLTDKQRAYYTNYYHLDLSLQEIAALFNVSRNAVHTQLKNVEKILNNFEDKLKLVETNEHRLKLLDLLEASKDFTYVDQIRKLDE